MKKKKTKKLGRPKLRSYRALRKEAWDVFSEYIRRVEKGICFTCGIQKNWKEQQAGHFIHRDCLDFVREAIHCQCNRCNTYLSGNLVEYTLKMLNEYGWVTVEDLKLKSHQIKKYSREELENIIHIYGKCLETMDQDKNFIEDIAL